MCQKQIDVYLRKLTFISLIPLETQTQVIEFLFPVVSLHVFHVPSTMYVGGEGMLPEAAAQDAVRQRDDDDKDVITEKVFSCALPYG